MTFFEGCFGPFYKKLATGRRLQGHLPQKSYSQCLRRTQIRLLIWWSLYWLMRTVLLIDKDCPTFGQGPLCPHLLSGIVLCDFGRSWRRVRIMRCGISHLPTQNVKNEKPCEAKVFLFSEFTSRHRQVTDLDVTVLGFSGPGLPSARQVLCGDAPRLFSIILVCI